MSKCELIELKDLSLNDPIELAAPSSHSGPPPVNPVQSSPFHVVRLVGDSVSIEARGRHAGDTGAGHDFQPDSYAHLAWCDLCGEFIWGLYKQSLRCANCSYTCHYRCRPFIQLDCSTNGSLITQPADYCEEPIETDTNVEKRSALSRHQTRQKKERNQAFHQGTAGDSSFSQEDSGLEEIYFTARTSFFHQPAEDELIETGKQALSVAEIQQRIKEYNAQINSNLYMVNNKDGTYTGFIKVHFQLVRPISLPPPQSPTQDDDQQARRMRRRTSFYLPKDTAKHLHISSETRVREVIEALLNKFTVVDNPAKFALFERTEKHSQVYMRKLSDDERPLYLRLCAGPSETVLCLVLKENETGEVNWDAFSCPELRNFLKILQREEEEHVRQIVKRYALARDTMKQAMARISTPG